MFFFCFPEHRRQEIKTRTIDWHTANVSKHILCVFNSSDWNSSQRHLQLDKCRQRWNGPKCADFLDLPGARPRAVWLDHTGLWAAVQTCYRVWQLEGMERKHGEEQSLWLLFTVAVLCHKIMQWTWVKALAFPVLATFFRGDSKFDSNLAV